jgi:hypothetical protein
MKTNPQQLVDTKSIRLALIEADGAGVVRVRGEFARGGVATQNKRVYPNKIWENEINRLGGLMKDRSVFGHPNHPSDGRTDLNKVSHIVTGLQLEDGILVGEAEILPTDAGRNLMVLLKANCKVGVSSRGFGSTKPNDMGEDVVQEDYKLVTFDFVADPADQTAYPEVIESTIFEGVDFSMTKLKTEGAAPIPAPTAPTIPLKVESAPVRVEDQEARFADDILSAVASMRSEVEATVRTSLLADPTVAGARAALEQVVGILRPFVLSDDAEAVVKSKESEIAKLKRDISERDLQITDLTKENTLLAEAAKTAGYFLYMERQLINDPDAVLIKKTIGDVKQYENAQALKDKLAAVRGELAERRAQQAKVEEERAAQQRKIEEEKAKELAATRALAKKLSESYEAKISKLNQAVDNLTQINQALAVQVHTEKKLRVHPRSSRIRDVIESSGAKTKKSVNQILESYRPDAVHDEDEAASLRARIRKYSRGGGGEESNPIYEARDNETESRAVEPNYNGSGVNLDELLRLSGTK